MITRFQVIRPPAPIAKYIGRMFLIESSGRLPSDDLKLIVPNACAKMVIPFRNGLVGTSSAWQHTTQQNKISFIGISDIPAMVDYASDQPAGNITVEFSPLGTYRFFSFRWKEISNGICDYTDIANKTARELEERLVNAGSLPARVAMVQQFLLQQFSGGNEDAVFDYCVERIMATQGRISIQALEKYTGYSARWLNMKFSDHLGISPKNLASIIRFQQYYRSMVTNKELFFLEKEFYHYYHDQSHFIRDFRRFTGLAPRFLSNASNQYDRVFYKE